MLIIEFNHKSFKQLFEAFFLVTLLSNNLFILFRLLHKYFFYRLSAFIVFFQLFIGCEKGLKLNNNSNFNKIDSTDLLIKKSKDKTISIKDRNKFLVEAYHFNQLEDNDSIRNNKLASVASEAHILNDTSLFLKANFEANTISKKNNYISSLARINFNYGLFYLKKEMLEKSFYHFNLSRDNYLKIDNSAKVANTLYNMAIIQSDLKDFTGSEILIFQAIPIFKQFKKQKHLYYCYNLLGSNYNGLQDYNKAIVYHTKALNILDKIDNNHNLRDISFNNLGLLYQGKGDYLKAIDYFNKILIDTNLKHQDPEDYARRMDNLNYSKFLNRDTTGILQNFKNSLRIRDSIQNISGIVISKLHIAEYLAFSTDTIKAIAYAKDASYLAATVNNHIDRLDALKLLSKLDATNANIYFKDYTKLNDSIQTQERKIRNKFTRIRFETDEYIEETEKLSQEKVVIFSAGLIISLLLASLYYIKIQRSKNQELLFEKEQQKANEEIYTLMLRQQSIMEEGRLKERHRIAEELHDGIIGRIFGTRLTFGFLDLKGSQEDQEKYNELLVELQGIEKDVRNISHELKSDWLTSQQNFNSIVTILVKKQSDIGGFKYNIILDDNINWLDIDGVIKINLYRIIQEALQNCYKHANATTIEIEFKRKQKTLLLIIKDDGKGFDISKNKSGIGLKNIKSRVSNIKGECTFESQINKGTSITVVIPNAIN